MIQIGSFTIQYERMARAWTARNGRFTKPFQTGAVGKRQAIRYAIGEAYPAVALAVAHLCRQNEQANGRAWAAALLLIAGHVLTPAADEQAECLARVLSQKPGNPRQFYLVTFTEMGFMCDCPDFTRGGIVIAGHLLCKHLLAYRLALHLSWELVDESPMPLHPKRTSGGRWRGKIATRVGAIQSASHLLSTHPDTPPTFQSGESIASSQQAAYAAYVATIGQRPFNAEKLMSWYIGR